MDQHVADEEGGPGLFSPIAHLKHRREREPEINFNLREREALVLSPRHPHSSRVYEEGISEE